MPIAQSPVHVDTSVQYFNQAQNVGIGTQLITSETATDTCNIRQKSETVSCGTAAVSTAEKQLCANVDTNSVALQHAQQQKDVEMQENVQTSSFGS